MASGARVFGRTMRARGFAIEKYTMLTNVAVQQTSFRLEVHMISRFILTTLLILSGSMLGCTDGPAISETNYPPELKQLSHLQEYGVPDGVDPLPPVAGHYPDIALSDLQASSNAAAAFYFEAMKAVKKADSWQIADSQLRTLIFENDDPFLPNYVKEQIIAGAIFRGTAILDDIETPIEPTRLDAIEHFLGLLIHNNSPDMLIVHRALEATRATWDDVTWRATAIKAAEAHNHYKSRIDSLKNCENCSGKTGIDLVADRLPDGFAEQVEYYRAKQASAARSLIALANAQ